MSIWADAKKRTWDKDDEKRTNKALRRNPDAEWLYTTTTTQVDMMNLVARGWEVVEQTNLAPAGGTSLWTKTLLRKRNPRLDKVA